jgi:hypothetical protein
VKNILLINPILYSEISIGFQQIESLGLQCQAAVFFAAISQRGPSSCWQSYFAISKKRGTKTTLLRDFYFGAHAVVSQFQLLTRDPSKYKIYFHTIKLICPG